MRLAGIDGEVAEVGMEDLGSLNFIVTSFRRNKNPAKDFCWWDLDGVVVCRCLCSGRWLVVPFRTSNKLNKLFYLTRPQLALLKSLPCSDR
jgi:hypothetical protein